MKTTLRGNDPPEILFHLRWVASIALWVGGLAAVGLALVLYVLTDATGQSYGELIQSHSLAQYRLGPALLISGFFLLGLTAMLTWLISLYSSFRIAGPLFRLSRNLEASISQGPVKPVPIRASDSLHPEAALLEETLAVLDSHYAGLGQELDQALSRANAGECTEDERLAISARLQKRLDRARF